MSTVAVAVCARCGFKVKYDSLEQDPDTRLWVCPPCVDERDPYELPPRRAEDISLQHPRPDEELE